MRELIASPLCSESEDEHEIRVKVVSPPLRPSGAVEVTKVS